MAKSCDIIMPVYNNEACLKHVLSALFKQKIPEGWKVRLIIVDDGSRDNTVRIIKETKAPSNWPPPLIIGQKHAGAAQARNSGIAAAAAEVIFFLGADIILQPGALKEHLSFHQANPQLCRAAVGLVKWDPRINPSPLMEWMAHGGPQNNFDDLLGQETASPRHFFYGSQLSLKRSMLKDNFFSDKFEAYGWEDLELGRRLEKQGLQLRILSQAVGLHRHFYTAKDIFRRQQAVGAGAVIYQGLYPREEILVNDNGWKRFKRLIFIKSGLLAVLAGVVNITAGCFSTPRLFSTVTALYYWRGVYMLSTSLYTPQKTRKAS